MTRQLVALRVAAYNRVLEQYSRSEVQVVCAVAALVLALLLASAGGPGLFLLTGLLFLVVVLMATHRVDSENIYRHPVVTALVAALQCEEPVDTTPLRDEAYGADATPIELITALRVGTVLEQK